jgi:hypothetical protein
MQDNGTGTWLARDGDGRVLEVSAAGYPGAEASPDDSRPVAEGTGSPQDTSQAQGRAGQPGRAAQQIPAGALCGRLAAARAEFGDRTARLGPPVADQGGVWGSAERDWEAEAGC